MEQNPSLEADKFSVLYGYRRFLTVIARARHWTQSWASWIQSTVRLPISV